VGRKQEKVGGEKNRKAGKRVGTTAYTRVKESVVSAGQQKEKGEKSKTRKRTKGKTWHVGDEV